MPKTSNAPAKYDVDYGAILKDIGLDPTDPKAQAVILICQRYGLDPVLRHVLLIKPTGNEAARLYITRDGSLHIAHQAGQLDGIEVLEQTEDETHYIAKVAVYRKDMSHAFVYVGRYPKLRTAWVDELDSNGKLIWEVRDGKNKPRRRKGQELHPYGPEMAVKCAEAMALRRAFDVALPAHEEIWDDPKIVEATVTVPAEVQDRTLPAARQEVVSSEAPGPAPESAPPQAPQEPPAPPVQEEASSPDPTAPLATQPQLKALAVMASKQGWDDEERHRQAGVASFKELTKSQASKLIDAWQNVGPAPEPTAPSGGADDVGSSSPAPVSPETAPNIKGAGTTPNLAALSDSLRELVIGKFGGKIKAAEAYLVSVSTLDKVAGTWAMKPEAVDKIYQEMK